MDGSTTGSGPYGTSAAWRRRLGELPMIETGANFLLTGWEGTLAPDSAIPSAPPAALKALVEPLALAAASSLRRTCSPEDLSFASAALPWQPLLCGLEQRVAAVYTMLVATRLDDRTSPERIGADHLAQVLVEDWVAGMRLFVRRLQADRERLARWLSLRELAPVSFLSAAASEVHGPAGPVLKLRFAGGHTIFYKPRPMSGELLWAELNEALAAVDQGISIARARVLAGGLMDGCDPRSDGASTARYGWMEALSTGECAQETHWLRAGALLCLASHLDLSDLHMSNLIATADGPAVLDAECLGDVLSSVDCDGDEPEQMERSLLATGLLPHPAQSSPIEVPDLSGLFGAPGPVRGLLLPFWKEAATGVAELSFVRATLLEQGNRTPARSHPLVCLPQMVSGYRRAAQALLSIRPALLQAGGWVARLEAQHSPRVVLRSTLSYGIMLSRSLTPRMLASKESRRTMLRADLTRAFSRSGIASTPEILNVEVEALLRLCLPCFYLGPGTRDLASVSGRVLLHHASARSSAEPIRQRLDGLRPNKIEGQVEAVLASILFHAHPPRADAFR